MIQQKFPLEIIVLKISFILLENLKEYIYLEMDI